MNTKFNPVSGDVIVNMLLASALGVNSYRIQRCLEHSRRSWCSYGEVIEPAMLKETSKKYSNEVRKTLGQ